MVGALIGLHIPKTAFYPIILVMLIAVGAYTLFKPSLGEATVLRFSGHRHTVFAMLTGFVIGVYDGALGPGTGSFLGLRARRAHGLRVPRGQRQGQDRQLRDQPRGAHRLHPGGHVMWAVGGRHGRRPTSLGGYVGARTAVARGSRFVRIVFIVVVGAFIVRIGGDLLGGGDGPMPRRLRMCRRRALSITPGPPIPLSSACRRHRSPATEASFSAGAVAVGR